MSRTYRRKSGDRTELDYQTSEMVRVPGRYIWYWIPMDPTTEQYKRAVNKYHSDAGTQKFTNRPQGWWVNLYNQRPYRRDAKQQIHKWMMDLRSTSILELTETDMAQGKPKSQRARAMRAVRKSRSK